MAQKVGVVSIQGDFDKHIRVLGRISGIEPLEIRIPEDLKEADRLIIPGGESSTVGLLMERFGLGTAIREFVDAGRPAWGTCMGMILLAKEIRGSSQFRLGLLDIEVERNAFGSQIDSFETELFVEPLQSIIDAVFIRAPIVVRWGPEVKPIAELEGKVVAVQEGNRIGSAFHPELTDDQRFHEWFCRL